MSDSSFDKYSFGSSDDKSHRRRERRNQGGFEDWYSQFDGFRKQWQHDKGRIKDDLKREAAEWRHEFRKATNGKEPKQLVGEAVQTLMTIFDEAVSSSKARKNLSEGERMRLEQYRRREEEFNRLNRSIAKAERTIDRKRKSAIVLGILSGAAYLIDSTFGPITLIFGGFAALNFWQSREAQTKLQRLYGDREQFGLLEAPPSYSTENEKAILRHAYEHKGRVYPEMLAIQSDLSLTEIEQMLKVCVDRRLAAIELDEKGRTYYYFSSLDESDPYANLSGTPS